MVSWRELFTRTENSAFKKSSVFFVRTTWTATVFAKLDKNGEIHSSFLETNEENPLKQALLDIFGEIIIEWWNYESEQIKTYPQVHTKAN